MNARTRLSDELKAALPGFRVIGFNANLDAVPKKTVMLWASQISRPERFQGKAGLFTFDLWVLVGQENSGTADNALDTALDDVIAALQPIGWVDWSLCERGVLFDTFHGWKVTVNAVAPLNDDTPTEGND